MVNKKTDATIHKMPADFKKALASDSKAYTTWEDITPNARKNWICWIISAKKEETRVRRIEVGLSKLGSGMRRPCCFEGCRH